MASLQILNPREEVKEIFDVIFTEELKEFVENIFLEFDEKIDGIFDERLKRQNRLFERETKNANESFADLANFIENELLKDQGNHDISNGDWTIGQLPNRLKNRHLDLGDVSPSDTERFFKCLKLDPSHVQGIQVDFDDGHCPTWKNQLLGYHNIIQAVQNGLENSPVLMLRPRAWNMTDQAVAINEKKVNGALLDFAILIFHCGKALAKSGSTHEDRSGPFFYLSKLETAQEAKLWSEIFTWSEIELGLKHGSVKACILIENIFAAFDMETILFQIRDHAIGLNCGIWDYSASIINKFGNRLNFIIPDRKKYVNMEREFLRCYMKKVIQVCHKHGALATGGMSAQLLSSPETSLQVTEAVCKAKAKEIEAGVDGFLVYDLDLLDALNKLWLSSAEKLASSSQNENITSSSLLDIPSGGATMEGLVHNIGVGILFIHSWICDGKGSFQFKGSVEDSATAEISRSQVWQWVKHGVRLEDGDQVKITLELVEILISQFLNENAKCKKSSKIFMEIVSAEVYPEFITTYLSTHQEFINNHF